MEKSVSEVLSNNGDNYIFPFLWMRGEEEEILRNEISKIDECGIKSICIEARPHPDFAGEKWWHDVDIVIDEAKKRNMKIWILDDAHFPTGMANGLLEEKYPERAKQYLLSRNFDVVGPISHFNINIDEVMKPQITWMDLGKEKISPLMDERKIISVIAVPLIRENVVGDEAIDLTPHINNGILTASLPKGVWRIVVSFTTFDEGGKRNYINPIDEDSVKVLIEAVYEKHFERYEDEFGKTILGFFFDEPGFDNFLGFEMNESIGRKMMALPWNKDVPALLEKRLGASWKEKLLYLWFPSINDNVSTEVRYIFMDIITSLYEKNFSNQLGEWCSAHGVKSIGHVIEDNNQHSRLGVGSGHYYRAMAGQHMAGIDNIGGGIIPGNPLGTRNGIDSKDGAFSHYVLAKLGDSHAQLDEKKNGRLMCETFGAYGWGLGVRDMKWIADYLLTQGVNHFVPHAFSMAEYPDADCPPHFYARGNNPQFPFFAELMKYVNRMCHLFSDGSPLQEVGILYHGELEWMNDCMFMQEPAEELFNNQIDYTIIPIDFLEKSQVKALIIPETSYIDEKLARFIEQNTEKSIIFLNRTPEYVIDSDKDQAYWSDIIASCHVLSINQLSAFLKEKKIVGLQTSIDFQELAYRYYKKENDICLLMNTSLSKTFEGEIIFPTSKNAVMYDGLKNRLVPIEQRTENGSTICTVTLKPYESTTIVFSDDKKGDFVHRKLVSRKDISSSWKLSFAKSKEYPSFHDEIMLEELKPVSEIYPYFSGITKYEKDFELDKLSGQILLGIEEVFENAKVWVNNELVDLRLCPPYQFDLTDGCKVGMNALIIEVANTPARENQMIDNIFGPERIILEPSGMFGEVWIDKYE